MSYPDGRSYRTVFLSDLHLGSIRCDVSSLLACVSGLSAETVVLVGDIFDFWGFRVKEAWSHRHVLILRTMFRMVGSGTRVVIVPGNHDQDLLTFSGLPIDGIEIHREWLHETPGGQRYLVVHGHEQDVIPDRNVYLARKAAACRERLGAFSLLSLVRRRRDHEAGHWKSKAWRKMRRSLGGVHDLELRLAELARARGCDGVICGHTHMAADRMIDGVRYLNCGDWISSCTAIVELADGTLELMHYGEQGEAAIRPPPLRAPELLLDIPVQRARAS